MRCSTVIIAIVVASFLSVTHCQFQLTNSEYVEKQLMCALDRGPCDFLGQQIKQALPNVIGKNCESCNARESAFAARIATFVQRNYPAIWVQLVQKYGNYGK
ncbi:uncharacterized protein LOC108734435 [Agrilus planipennis]|uniref:Uncharacterized protein LOC108734435 n=1 Tax=Agrilus planipennis TaxID=224129 RepID=A0A1W4WBZ6_AGRPL|nr:uncharacterized protein LOC108734435 [Agrilus planipennis]